MIAVWSKTIKTGKNYIRRLKADSTDYKTTPINFDKGNRYHWRFLTCQARQINVLVHYFPLRLFLAGQQITPGRATYLRVSDEDKQTPERFFAMQRLLIQDSLLTPSDVPFSREYTDLLSGTNPKRKDYQQMLSDAAAGKFSHLGLYRADRFGRNTIEGLQAATQLMSIGIKIRIANMPGLQPEYPDGCFLFLLTNSKTLVLRT